MQLLELEQGSDSWHQTRKLSIGSSDASVIMDVDPYRTYDELLLEKTGRSNKKFVTNDAIELGKKWEGSARETFNFMHDLYVQPMVGRHDNHAFILASFDGLCERSKTLIEIKYVGEKKLLEYLDSGPPEHHYAQMQHQLLVSGFDKMWYVPYNLADKRRISRIEYIPVERDNRYIDQLVRAELMFMDKVQALTSIK